MTYAPYGTIAPTQEDTNMDSACTQLLCHCDGNQGDTVVTDSSIYSLSSTVSGNAIITTSSPKFGSGCLYFDGNSSSKVVFDNSSGVISPGANDFTIECWLNIKSSKTKTNVILAQTESTAQHVGWSLITTSGSGSTFGMHFKFLWNDNGTVTWTTFSSQPGYTMSVDAWHHVAVSRDNNMLTMSFDGVMIPEMKDLHKGGIVGGTNPYLRFGHNLYSDETDGNGTMDGYLDEVRLTFGKCVYKAGPFTSYTPTGVYYANFPAPANFTPPVSAYTNPPAIIPGVDGAIRANGSDAIYYKNGSGAWVRIEDINTTQQRYIRP